MNSSGAFNAFLRGAVRNYFTRTGALFLLILTTLPATAGAQLAYAHVNADGTIDQDSGNVTVARPDAFPGGYCIGVSGGTAQTAIVSLDSLPNVGGTVQAGVFFASVCLPFPDAHDILVVTRPQAQDGGSPGEDRAFYIIVAGAAGPVVSRSSRQGQIGATITQPAEASVVVR
jgi:hypothetical protein